ncbi:MAG: 3-deoxy-D-manno-octulosonic acid transferase [Desulfobacteraceae bacterium]|jgi:3-deoxy-D-manno-octulosonic-acid transferase
MGLRERLGFVPLALTHGLKGSARIWVHAVSLGEVKVAVAIIESLRRQIPGCWVMLSTTTEHGRHLAQQTFGEDVPVFYAPIDHVFSVRKALKRARPDVMVFLETEIWPAWLVEAHRMGIKTALINGRISPRSIGRYLKFRPFFRQILEGVEAFSMILEEDASRIRDMGAETCKIETNGNAKYDLLVTQADPVMEAEMRRILSLQPSQRVFVAGSTREGEEAMVLDVYEKILDQFPDTILVIAPRHIDRTPAIEALLKSRGFGYQLRTEFERPGTKREERVVIMNTFGELFKLYSVGTINFCGASLVPLGGQNPLEPAAWGKAVFYGPSMEDFLDAKALLEEAGAGIPVSSPAMLAEKAIKLLSDTKTLEAHGARAREAVIKNQRAAEKHAGVVARLV